MEKRKKSSHRKYLVPPGSPHLAFQPRHISRPFFHGTHDKQTNKFRRSPVVTFCNSFVCFESSQVPVNETRARPYTYHFRFPHPKVPTIQIRKGWDSYEVCTLFLSGPRVGGLSGGLARRCDSLPAAEEMHKEGSERVERVGLDSRDFKEPCRAGRGRAERRHNSKTRTFVSVYV